MTEYEMYESGMSIHEVHEATGIALSTLRNRFKKAGILRSRIEGIKNASKRNRLGVGLRGKKRVFTEEHKNNISKSKKGKGRGYRICSNGYIEYTMGENKGRLEHIVIMERHIGRKLLPNECVHHIDEDKTNNNIENLQLMTRSEHAALHATENHIFRERDEGGRFI